jgi:thiol:disulfide interchange protein DsbA
MKKIVILGCVASFALAACGREEPPAPEEPEPTVEEVAPEAPDEPTEAVPEDEAQPELVEESAAEPEDEKEEEQPIVLAPEPEPAATVATREWTFSDGQHFHRLVPTQPTVGGADKIEVAEIFWYGCPHCFNFEPAINSWAETVPQNARFVRIPAVWNPLAKLHGRLYYTEEVLARNGKLKDPDGFHAAVFNEFHRRGNRLTSEGSIQRLFERFGVGRDDFLNVWNSFEVNQKVLVAGDLVKRYNVTGVPAVVVNGKYRTGASEAGGYPRMLEVIDELIERETVR